jgi:hypothetical protein
MPYIHERPDWPKFTWKMEALAGPPAEIRHKQGLAPGADERPGPRGRLCRPH